MNELTQKHCVPCEGNIPPLSRVESEKLHVDIPEWLLMNDARAIQREFTFKNFTDALAFVNKVGELAESEGHHPDITLAWGKVGITLTTHALKGLSENDFILAAKINELS